MMGLQIIRHKKDGIEKPLLSILIATIPERQNKLLLLLRELKKQIRGRAVEIIVAHDRKENSIGAKRQKLLEAATGKWIVYLDDDDWPMSYYVSEILAGAHQVGYDCMNINGVMTTNGDNKQTWCHKHGEKVRNGAKSEEHDYYRPIIHFNPVLREKALKAGFRDMRFGEDVDYGKRLAKFISRPYTIEKPLFHYRYDNRTPHNKKYGISK